jgi:1-deoxy-D-xylulose-5-phosphate synthase
MSILKTIQSPSDLKRLSPTQFPALCQELREQIIDVVSNVGGHLASNLGVIELTVALHYLLNSPKDKIVWDKPTRINYSPDVGNGFIRFDSTEG